MKDPVFGIELPLTFIETFKVLQQVDWLDFLEALKVREALKIASATSEDERAKVQVRVLMIDELSNFSKSLFTIDTAT